MAARRYNPDTGCYDVGPLTAAHFEGHIPGRYAEVDLVEEDYGDAVYAFGHVDRSLMRTAVNRWLRENGSESIADTDVQHCWAGTVANDADGWRFRFIDGNAARYASSVFPLTVVRFLMADLFVQWKGTEACLDFTCTCGKSYHVDDFTFGGLKCTACGAAYKLGQPTVKAVDPADWWGLELGPEHQEAW